MLSEELHTLIFAKMFGMYLFLMAIIMLARATYYREMIRNLKTTNGTIVVTGSFGLMLGLLLVTIHNNWAWDSDVIVTIFGWIVLIKSILWLSLPERMLQYTRKMYDGPGYYIILSIVAISGIILMMKGFYLYVHWNPATLL